MPVHTDPNRRHDFVLLFDVTDGNPNGDPDAGNLPRTDPETMQGLVTDVALKRKVRNFVALVAEDEDEERRSALNIYVEHKGVALNTQHRKAYRALDIPTTEPNSERVTDPEVLEALRAGPLPEGFTLVEPQDESGDYELVYSGGLSEEDRKAAVEAIGAQSAKAKRFADKVSKGAKTVKPTREQVDRSRDWMCQNFYDIRMFGAVMTTEVNAGQVRGPLQLTFARSVDPVIPQDLAITRVAITREAEREQKETEIGRKTLIPYGLYVGYGFYSPYLAKQTGVTEADLELFWDALVNMWTFDRSASRGLMTPRLHAREEARQRPRAQALRVDPGAARRRFSAQLRRLRGRDARARTARRIRLPGRDPHLAGVAGRRYLERDARRSVGRRRAGDDLRAGALLLLPQAVRPDSRRAGLR